MNTDITSGAGRVATKEVHIATKSVTTRTQSTRRTARLTIKEASRSSREQIGDSVFYTPTPEPVRNFPLNRFVNITDAGTRGTSQDLGGRRFERE